MQGIRLTQDAAIQLERELSLQDGYSAVRVEVKGGGCSGYRYNLSLDIIPRGGDDIIEHYGVKLYYNAILFRPLLDGMTIDFDDGLMGGFKFLNPNATASCGCGESFAG